MVVAAMPTWTMAAVGPKRAAAPPTMATCASQAASDLRAQRHAHSTPHVNSADACTTRDTALHCTALLWCVWQRSSLAGPHTV